jgi:RNA polymerase sigma-70 factor (ECF subfamily)
MVMTTARASVWPDLILPASAPPAVADEIATLTSSLARGDEEAWRKFFDLYFVRLLRYLLVVHRGSEDLAREVLQLTFLRAARHMRCFHSDESLWSWLTVLARTAAADEGRKRMRYWKFLGRFRQERSPAPAPVEEDRWESALERALSLLDPADREVIEQKYFSGMTVRELASVKAVSEKAIESRLVRARQRLKRLILEALAQ